MGRYQVTIAGVSKMVRARDVDGALDAFARKVGYADFDEWARLSCPPYTVVFRGKI